MTKFDRAKLDQWIADPSKHLPPYTTYKMGPLLAKLLPVLDAKLAYDTYRRTPRERICISESERLFEAHEQAVKACVDAGLAK